MDLVKKLKSDPKIDIAIIDPTGNALVYYKDGRIAIRIATEKRERKIGLIKDRMLFVDRALDKHLHRKSNSYGFNYNLLKLTKRFDFVAINEDSECLYIVPRQTILDFGRVMYFKTSEDGNSFEVQIFLNRDIIKKYKK